MQKAPEGPATPEKPAAPPPEQAKALTLPYLKLIEVRDAVKVFLVDGNNVRTFQDTDFTQGGHSFSFSKIIPKDEIWVDQEAAPDEQRYIIDHYFIERALMQQGWNYVDALNMADKVQRKERGKKRLERFLDVRPKHDELPKAVYVRRLQESEEQAAPADGKAAKADLPKQEPPVGDPKSGKPDPARPGIEQPLPIFLVNGKKIRDVLDIEFTQGGHDCVYPYIPESEVWIDDDVIDAERKYVVLHELHERALMAKGMKYGRAHWLALKKEKAAREADVAAQVSVDPPPQTPAQVHSQNPPATVHDKG
jgi:hypothetical protein